MAGITRRAWLSTLGLAPVAGGLGAWVEARHVAEARPRLTGRERIQQHHLPNVELTAHTGRRLRFYDDLVKDKKVIINFMYVRCEGICSPVTMNLARVQKLLGDRPGRSIFTYSITLKPQEDSVNDLRAYADEHAPGAAPGWLFLTGAPDDVERLRRALGFTYADPTEDADTSNHIGMLRYGVEAQTWWGACPGMGNPEHIARSILWDLA